MKRIIFFGELYPKTIHGASLSNTIIVKKLSHNAIVKSIEEFSPLTKHESFSFIKLFFFLKSYLSFIYSTLVSKYDLYYGVMYLSFFGIIKNIITTYHFRCTNKKGEIILHFHRSDFKDFLAKKRNIFLFRILDKVVTNYVVLSKIQAQQVSFFTTKKVSILPNTVEYFFDPRPYNYISEIVSPLSCTIKVLFLSNYIEDKGIFEAIKAVKEINRTESKYKVILSCHGQFTNNSTKDRIKELSHEDSAVILNSPIYGEEKFKAIASSHLLLLPSKNEGLPLVLLESLSLGIPIIISNVGYIPEVLGEGYDYYCNPYDYKTIINAIERYYHKFDYIARKEILDIYKKYSNDSHTDQLKKIFLR